MTQDKPVRLIIRATKQEVDQLKLAARLRGLPITAYVKQAINRQLIEQGVDAVLFEELR